MDSHLSNLELRVKTLEDSLGTVKSDLSAVVAKMSAGSSDEDLSEVRLSQQNERSVDLVGSEDTVDAMGAVAFADEEDCGFFGRPPCFGFTPG